MLKITFPLRMRYLVIQFHLKSYRITICKTCKATGRKWYQEVSVCTGKKFSNDGFHNARWHGACALPNNSFLESHVSNYNIVSVKIHILFWMRYLGFINISVALMSTGVIMMVCLHFYNCCCSGLLPCWGFTKLVYLISSHNSVVHMFAYIQNVASPLDGYRRLGTPNFKGQTVKETYFVGNVFL